MAWARAYHAARKISTHALREEGDLPFVGHLFPRSQISTHALREEGDGHNPSGAADPTNFYPRPP